MDQAEQIRFAEVINDETNAEPFSQPPSMFIISRNLEQSDSLT